MSSQPLMTNRERPAEESPLAALLRKMVLPSHPGASRPLAAAAAASASGAAAAPALAPVLPPAIAPPPAEAAPAAPAPRGTRGLRFKTYFAPSVEAAVNEARQELGPEAMLVSSKKSELSPGEYEVVFALPPGGAAPPREKKAPRQAQAEDAEADAPSLGSVVTELSQLRRKMDSIQRALARSAQGGPGPACPRELAEVYASLVAADVDSDLARDVVEELMQALAGAPVSELSLRRALRTELTRRFAVSPGVGVENSTPRIAMLVGPPGSGKTTTLAKLAVRYGLTARKPLHILSVDTYRIAATEQLRSYSAILGVGFTAVDTIPGLQQAIEERRAKELLLIDTAGYSVGDLDHGMELADWLAGRKDIDVHLVLDCSTKPADLSRAADRFEMFRPNRIIFTKLDETESYGPVLAEAARTGKPISFLTAGQHVPEDIEPADQQVIVDLVLHGKNGSSGARPRPIDCKRNSAVN